jgi:hypothetical protein
MLSVRIAVVNTPKPLLPLAPPHAPGKPGAYPRAFPRHVNTFAQIACCLTSDAYRSRSSGAGLFDQPAPVLATAAAAGQFCLGPDLPALLALRLTVDPLPTHAWSVGRHSSAALTDCSAHLRVLD